MTYYAAMWRCITKHYKAVNRHVPQQSDDQPFKCHALLTALAW